MLLTVNKLNTVLSGVIGSTKYNVGYNEQLHAQLQDLEQKFDDANTIEEAAAIIAKAEVLISEGVEEDTLKAYGDYLKYNSKTEKFYLHCNGVTSSVPLPKVLANYIVEATDNNMPTLPYIKAWMWFMKNPLFSKEKAKLFADYITTTYVDKAQLKKLIDEGYTYERATALSTYNDLSITKNGLLSTYKYVQINYKKYNKATGEVEDRYESEFDEETGIRTVKLPSNAEDYTLLPPVMGTSGDAFYSGADLGHTIRVGAVHELPRWDMVDCRDLTSCVKGLHLGGQSYIEGYGFGNTLLLNCFVNPMHIGAFTNRGGGAIRVKEYFVHSAQFAPAKAKYNESTYLERSKEQWDEMLAEIISDSEARINKIKNKTAELSAL